MEDNLEKLFFQCPVCGYRAYRYAFRWVRIKSKTEYVCACQISQAEPQVAILCPKE